MTPVRATRRSLIAAAGASLATRAWTQESGPSLRALAARKGLYFGSAVGAAEQGLAASFNDPTYRRLLVDECAALVCENEMKWYVVRPDASRFAFARADRIAAFARDQGMRLRGHTLLWHHPRWSPAWTETHDYGPQPAREAERLLREHVDRVCGRYPQVFSWDVVNEAVDEKTGMLRETAFSRRLGPAVIDIAFHAARQAAPQGELVYNDYMSWTPGDQAHRSGVLRLLEGFRRRGVPVDTLGLQSHIGSESGAPAERERLWRRFLDEVTGMGFGLLVTEFDVNDRAYPGDIAARDAAVADEARRYLDLTLDYRQTRGVMAWGLMDNYSWLTPRVRRPDGLATRPTPYDAEGRRKPLRDAIAAALLAAPDRRETQGGA